MRKARPKKEAKSVDYTPNLEVKELEIPVEEKIEVQKEEPTQNFYTIKVTDPALYMREGPSLSSKIVGLITDKGEYKIINENNGWGKLENGNWIMLAYTKIV